MPSIEVRPEDSTDVRLQKLRDLAVPLCRSKADYTRLEKVITEIRRREEG